MLSFSYFSSVLKHYLSCAGIESRCSFPKTTLRGLKVHFLKTVTATMKTMKAASCRTNNTYVLSVNRGNNMKINVK